VVRTLPKNDSGWSNDPHGRTPEIPKVVAKPSSRVEAKVVLSPLKIALEVVQPFPLLWGWFGHPLKFLKDGLATLRKWYWGVDQSFPQPHYFFFVLCFLKKYLLLKDILDISNTKFARVSYLRNFLSILMLNTNGRCQLKRNSSLKW